MFGSIERVYDASKAKRKLGFACKTGFREILDSLA
jgi:UDP-glucose 4-epimerase